MTHPPPPSEPVLYRAIWPVLARHLLVDLVEEARPDLERLLVRGRCIPIARARWTIRPGRDVPGSGGAAEVLVADVPVRVHPRSLEDAHEAILDEQDHRRRLDGPARQEAFVEDLVHLLDSGLTEPAILDRLGLTSKAFERKVHRAGRGDLLVRARPDRKHATPGHQQRQAVAA